MSKINQYIISAFNCSLTRTLFSSRLTLFLEKNEKLVLQINKIKGTALLKNQR
jgi:hypothetical protein